MRKAENYSLNNHDYIVNVEYRRKQKETNATKLSDGKQRK